MLAAKTVTEVRRLLAEGTHSQRKIARLTGVSRGSIGAIASGRRPDYKPPDDEEDQQPTGPPERCPGCGGQVYMPCRLCRTREALEKHRRPTSRRTTIEPIEPLKLNLRPEHRARYEQVRAWREQDDAGRLAAVS